MSTSPNAFIFIGWPIYFSPNQCHSSQHRTLSNSTTQQEHQLNEILGFPRSECESPPAHFNSPSSKLRFIVTAGLPSAEKTKAAAAATSQLWLWS
ncbi:hypothetical protein AVEN_178808-1 [Araneus ventricosus]|uniref:Uncharacterized protein n=1 Tax=Araneus ventricosus TaxID=182803 RepID=A0A4Y2BDL5_ARAVE|nr:hypothetical protein AVEN_178808-1 [Araneus ventricosus]